ncbi:hypothetical protein GCM10027168_46790 [Streptomyces capparidis]
MEFAQPSAPPGPPGGAALAGHAPAITALAGRWLPLAERDAPGADLVCSPAGLWLALAAVAAGARGGTARELRDAVGVAGPEAARAVTAAADALGATDALAVATGVWSGVPVYREFREALPRVGFGPLDPAGPGGVDAWVARATGGLIERLPVRPSPGTLLLLVNALALKGRWAEPFPARLTAPAPFTDASGARSRVPTMSRSLPPGDAWYQGRTAVVELRCRREGAGEPVRVRFALGAPDATASEVLPAAWAPRAAGGPARADVVLLRLPRLSLRSLIEVTQQLPELGVELAASGAADFSLLSPEPLRIDQVVQEAVLTVAEEGVEAAAVTMVPMAAGSAPVRRRYLTLSFDRPFGIVVLDGTGTVPLFAAWQATAPNGPRGPSDPPEWTDPGRAGR